MTVNHRPWLRRCMLGHVYLCASGRSVVHCGLLCLVVFTGVSQAAGRGRGLLRLQLTAVLGTRGEVPARKSARRVRLEPSGSQVAARKVVELGMRADIVAVADAGIIGKMMIPRHAS